MIANAAMIEAGIERAAMTVGPNVGEEEEHDDRRQQAADQEVLLHRIDRGLDEDRLVAATSTS